MCALLQTTADHAARRGASRLRAADRRILARASARPCAGSTHRTASYGHWAAGGLQGTCSLCRSAAVRLGLSGACPQLDRRLGPWMASGLGSAFTAALPRPMYRITCPSRTRLHARSQVPAMHRGLMYRIIGHYPIVSPATVVSGNGTAASALSTGALAAAMPGPGRAECPPGCGAKSAGSAGPG